MSVKTTIKIPFIWIQIPNTLRMEGFASVQTDIHEDDFIIINEMIPNSQAPVSGHSGRLLVRLGENPPLLWPLTFNFSSWSALPELADCAVLRGGSR